ncbi:sulfatase family protein [Sedimentisphaera salicampi]|uniref:sulfatase family protein n=1 Tax=Sedimentisphaera salicampi TaxID=1941349 RepID=UPI000B9D3C61|nr:sulfatase [Sedimentisphaera salicampi]OXU14665.1 Arylsulfatase [Sedimentisphaera salicampi]
MNRRTFLKTSCYGTAGLALGSLSSMSPAADIDRPNLIYVFADQLGVNHCSYAKYWNGTNYHNAQHAHTPNIDNFASQGINFKNCVSNMPVCSAYRASLFTGKYTTTNGMVINELRMNPYHECLGHVLTRGGYNTAYIGKWHLYANQLGNHYDPNNSFVPRGEHRLGFNGFWAAYNFHHDYYGDHAYYHTESKDKIRFGEGVYEPDGQTDLAIDWLKCRAQKSSLPFSMVLSYGTPHAPWNTGNVPPEYMDMFADKSMPNPPNYEPENDEPYSDSWADLSPNARAHLEQRRRIYYAMTTNLDWNFGRLLDYLEESGLADNTIVVFTSDHGEMFGSHGREAKNTFYEEAARIPFLVRWPEKVPAGQVSDACISTVDFMPTLLDLMKLPIPSRVEGQNLSHICKGESGAEPEFAFLQNTGACAAWQNGYEWRAVRDKQYTYARYRVDGAELLFDNLNDPYQMNNLASDPAYSSKLSELKTKMENKMASISDENQQCTWYRDHFTDGNRNILRGSRG